MAVTDDNIYHPTEALVLPKPRRHFRVGMRCEHWQLRSSIGANSSARYIYYIAGTANTQVHKLDTVTNESEIVKILTFAPRCLVAKNGWISCGGEKGECVAFQMDEPGETSDSTRVEPGTIEPSLSALDHYVNNGGPRSSDVLDAFRDHVQGLPDDVRVQLALETAPSDSHAVPSLVGEHDNDPMPALIPYPAPEVNTHNKNLVARSKSFGTERINCVTLWFPPTSVIRKYSGAYSQSVAVLANNDQHVTIVGLESQEVIDEVMCPDYVNRGVISPDGQLLVAICDDPYLYVHERVPKQGLGSGLFTRKDLTDFEWKLCAKVHLKSQRKEDRSDQRGSFAACFSNTGRYLAVGTQYGVISIFETAAFRKPGFDPLVTTFSSTRSKEEMGAIRDMAFCPGPFDLLAWTEHRGYVGVADLRNKFVSRQILDLNRYDDYEQIMVTEKGSIDPRLLERNEDGELTLAQPTDAAAARRLARRPTTERIATDTTNPALGRDFHPPLAADETLVLEALSAHRRRRDQMNVTATDRDPPSPGTRLLERLSNRASTRGAYFRGLEENNNANRNRVAELDRARAQTERLRETAERVRARRLLDSARLLNSTDANLTTTAERAASVAAALRQLRNHDTGPEHRRVWNASDADTLFQNWDLLGDASIDRPQEAGGTMRDRDYLASVWNTILRNRGEEPTEPATTTAAASAAASAHERRANRRMAAERTATHVNRMEREHDNTAGLAWSEDGSILIIGAEDGIYEFHVNKFNRKIFPSITLR